MTAGGVEHFLAELDLALGDAGDVEQIIDDDAEVEDLAVDDLVTPGDVVLGVGLAGDGDGIADGGEGIPQLVGEHGEEFVLVGIGPFQVGRPLA